MYGLGVNKLGASRSILGNAISNLFSNGEQGVWYDPSDISTMLQEDSSLAPAVIGQPVGTILDKSQGLKLGSEMITNGSFDTDTNWSKATGWSIANGVASADNISGKNLTQGNLGLVTNAVYEVIFTVATISSGSVLARFGGSTPVSTSAYTSAGTYKAILRANASNTTFAIRGQGGFTGTIDNVSLKLIEGNHARQITSDKRPILARHPEGGIRNLVSYTQEFDDDYWTHTNMNIVANDSVAPDGTNTADKITSTTQYNNIRSPVLINTTGTTATISVWLKNVDGNVLLRLRGSTSGGTYLKNINITNEWARYSLTVTHDGTQNIHFIVQDGNASGHGSFLMWGAQVELGSTATQYQHVTDDLRYDITEPFGAGSINYLSFDGSNDCLQVITLDMSASDELTAHSGHRKIGTSNAILYEHSSNSGGSGNTGTFKVNAPHASNDYIFGAIGTVNKTVNLNGADYASPVTFVSTHTVDISADSQVVRMNGVQVNSSTSDLGVGNFTDRTFNIGSRNNGFGLPFNGNLYGLIIRGKVSTDKEIKSTESYLAKKSGVLAETAGLATLSLNFDGDSYTARNRNGGIL